MNRKQRKNRLKRLNQYESSSPLPYLIKIRLSETESPPRTREQLKSSLFLLRDLARNITKNETLEEVK